MRDREKIDGIIEKEVPDMPLTSAGIGADCQARFANSQEQMVRTGRQKAKKGGAVELNFVIFFEADLSVMRPRRIFAFFATPTPLRGTHRCEVLLALIAATLCNLYVFHLFAP